MFVFTCSRICFSSKLVGPRSGPSYSVVSLKMNSRILLLFSQDVAQDVIVSLSLKINMAQICLAPKNKLVRFNTTVSDALGKASQPNTQTRICTAHPGNNLKVSAQASKCPATRESLNVRWKLVHVCTSIFGLIPYHLHHSLKVTTDEPNMIQSCINLHRN